MLEIKGTKFHQDGKELFLIGSGSEGLRADEMKAGVNCFRISIDWTRDTPYLCNSRSGDISSLWGGFNEKPFRGIGLAARNARDAGAYIVVILWGTPTLKAPKAEFGQRLGNHLAYIDNGGLIPKPKTATGGLSTWYRHTVLLDAQHLFIQKLCWHIGKHSNVMLAFMWECHVGFNNHFLGWANWAVRKARDSGYKNPVGFGTDHPDQIKEIESAVGEKVFYILEGRNPLLDIEAGKWNFPNTAGVHFGYHPSREGYAVPPRKKNTEGLRQCKYFTPAYESYNIRSAKKTIDYCFEAGHNSGLLFDIYTDKINERRKEQCIRKFPKITYYNYVIVKAAILNYVSNQGWLRVPGKPPATKGEPADITDKEKAHLEEKKQTKAHLYFLVAIVLIIIITIFILR